MCWFKEYTREYDSVWYHGNGHPNTAPVPALLLTFIACRKLEQQSNTASQRPNSQHQSSGTYGWYRDTDQSGLRLPRCMLQILIQPVSFHHYHHALTTPVPWCRGLWSNARSNGGRNNKSQGCIPVGPRPSPQPTCHRDTASHSPLSCARARADSKHHVHRCQCEASSRQYSRHSKEPVKVYPRSDVSSCRHSTWQQCVRCVVVVSATVDSVPRLLFA